MKKTCKNCANFNKYFNRECLAIKSGFLGQHPIVRENKDRAACKHWRRDVTRGGD